MSGGTKTRVTKITLREAIAQGCDGLLFYCQALGCGHEGEMPMDMAVARWPLRTRLDQIHPVCTKCRSRDVDVRPRWPAVGPGGMLT